MNKTSHFQLRDGFTLLELMIAVFIITVLVMIALPSYKNYLQASRRTDAITILMHLQLAESHYRATNNRYASLSQLGVSNSSHYYHYGTSDISATTYTLTATAKTGSSQTTDIENGTACSTLNLHQDNSKTPTVCWPNIHSP